MINHLPPLSSRLHFWTISNAIGKAIKKKARTADVLK